MSDAERDEEESPPLPYPIRAGPRSITWSRPLPAELEEVSAQMARIENPLEWFRDDPNELERHLRAVIMAYECSETSRPAEMFPPLYMAFMDLVSVDARRTFLIETWKEVAKGNADTAVLWLIAMYETHPLLVAIATECYAYLQAEMAGEAACVADDFLGVFEKLSEEGRAGAFQGLMVLGDSEVLDLLRPYRWELTSDEVLMVCSLPLDGVDTTVYLFLLDWLEEAQAEKDHAKARAIAAALTVDAVEIERAQKENSDPEVTGPPSLLRCEQPFFYVPIREFAQHIEPRLKVLAEHETGWPIVPPILEGWGLTPRGEAN